MPLVHIWGEEAGFGEKCKPSNTNSSLVNIKSIPFTSSHIQAGF